MVGNCHLVNNSQSEHDIQKMNPAKTATKFCMAKLFISRKMVKKIFYGEKMGGFDQRASLEL